MQILWVIILIIWAVAVNANKKKKVGQKKAPTSSNKNPAVSVNRGTATTATMKSIQNNHKKTGTSSPIAKSSESSEEGFLHKEERDGSIDMPPREAHEHEGKPMPCPADERETPRPRSADLETQPVAAQPHRLEIAFSQNAVLEGVIMSEILKRPEFRDGRRVYR